MKKVILILLMALAFFIVFFSCRTKKEIKTEKKKTVKTEHKHHKKINETEKAGTTALKNKLGLSARDIKSDRLYRFVEEWYGVPYKYGGCRKEGVDCSCFANILIETVYGQKLARTAGDMFKSCDLIEEKEAREGDLFFFKINDKNISHVGVYLRQHFFVHASTSAGVMINSLDENYYRKYFYCAGRIKST